MKENTKKTDSTSFKIEIKKDFHFKSFLLGIFVTLYVLSFVCVDLLELVFNA